MGGPAKACWNLMVPSDLAAGNAAGGQHPIHTAERENEVCVCVCLGVFISLHVKLKLVCVFLCPGVLSALRFQYFQ